MKTKEELNALKEEVETLNKKLHELTDEELEQVSGGGVKLNAIAMSKGIMPGLVSQIVQVQSEETGN